MVKGVPALRRRFSAVPDLIVKEVEAALAKYADEIVSEMKRLAPVLKKPDPRRRAGALRDSIGWTFGDAPKGRTALATVGSKNISGLKVTIHAGTRLKRLGADDAFYAHFVEFGTVKMPAQPFFWVSWRANRRRARAGITRAVKKALKKA